MPTVKIKPPEPLPARGLTEQRFDMWKMELRAWLSSDPMLTRFLPTGRYSTWQSEEENPDRIPQLAQPDPELQVDATEEQAQDLLEERRNQLLIFISQVASLPPSSRPATASSSTPGLSRSMVMFLV